MQYLYASEISDFEDTKQHYKNLSNSIHSIHDLYLLYISLLIEIFKKAVNKYKISHECVGACCDRLLVIPTSTPSSTVLC